jgi:hypothetical protein
MQNPYPIHLQTDEQLRSQGWTNVARDKDGHVISTVFRHPNDENEFKDSLLEWFSLGYTVTNLEI